MKTVLIVDTPPMLREFLKEKLSAEKVSIEIADSQRDALPKFLSLLPDLVIVNVEQSVSSVMEFLEKKHSDPNGKKVPVIMSGPKLENDEISDLVQYGVIKYFTRPIKFDLFFDAVGHVLHSAFSIDLTPSVLDMHLNKDIIFIELAKGLNREKITLLKYKLSEFIEANELTLPKIVVMMSNLSLSYVDGLNLDLLLTNLTSDTRILHRNIKILSLDPFIVDFISGHPAYDGIQVVQNLQDVLFSLVGATKDDVENVISDKILSVTDETEHDLMGVRFFADSSSSGSTEAISGGNLKIAIVDNDKTVVTYLARVSDTIGEVSIFPSCKDFISKIQPNQFDLVITGMYMPEVTGIDLLKYLIDKHIDLPVIVYSNVVQKEVIMQSLKLGASSYLIKPQPAEVIVQKALEIVNARRQA